MKWMALLLATSLPAFAAKNPLVGKTLRTTGTVCYFPRDDKDYKFFAYTQTSTFYVRVKDAALDKKLVDHLKATTEALKCRPISMDGTFWSDGFYTVYDADEFTEEKVTGPAGVYFVSLIGASPGDSSLAGHIGTMALVRRALEGDGLTHVRFLNAPGTTHAGMSAIVTSLHTLTTLQAKLTALNLSRDPRVTRLDLGVKEANASLTFR